MTPSAAPMQISSVAFLPTQKTGAPDQKIAHRAPADAGYDREEDEGDQGLLLFRRQQARPTPRTRRCPT